MPACMIGNAQQNAWLQGSWLGKASFGGSKLFQDFTIVLDISNINNNAFEGVLKTILPRDTVVHRDLQIRGTLGETFITMVPEKVLYVRNPRGNIKWENGCDSCRPPEMHFTIEKGRFIFRGEIKGCLKQCNGIREFSRSMDEFDSTLQKTLYALAGMPFPEKELLVENSSEVSEKISASLQNASVIF